jgi:hypothetical protein
VLIARRLTFLTRQGCGLCAEALPRFESVMRWLPLDLEVVDIGSDPELEARYHLRIPVVLDRNGRVLAEGQISRCAAVAAVLRGAI